jgi:hypothetical protein
MPAGRDAGATICNAGFMVIEKLWAREVAPVLSSTVTLKLKYGLPGL